MKSTNKLLKPVIILFCSTILIFIVIFILVKKDKQLEMQNLLEVSEEEQLRFIDGIDHLLVDLDGVVKIADSVIPGANECLDKFKRLGKSVSFVSNNALNTPDEILQKLLHMNLTVDINDIFNPQMAVLDYLQRINYQKKIYMISTDSYKEYLRKEGFKIVDSPNETLDESLPHLSDKIKDDPEIELVVADFDYNISLLKITQAGHHLLKPNITFLTGGTDKTFPASNGKFIVACHYIYKALEDYSGKKPITLAKPSKDYSKVIQAKLKITDPTRVLFIGDTVVEDLGFATVNNYQKLLVLTGNTKMKNIQNWTYPEEYKPNYYIQSLHELNMLLAQLKNV
uniref:4-nitrophenylphosphatase-like n=1 Tax=Diabrotica virgifera virgifera TaxID=50390 RepID=A0A6P7F223_DIAVI